MVVHALHVPPSADYRICNEPESSMYMARLWWNFLGWYPQKNWKIFFYCTGYDWNIAVLRLVQSYTSRLVERRQPRTVTSLLLDRTVVTYAKL